MAILRRFLPVPVVALMALKGAERYFVMRHPDGGFRKLASADTPAGLVEFDGAQRAESQRVGDEIVLSIGDDRYRWEAPGDE